tara:strand:- start:1260 stop:2030 length:771 start_codon:yes stop_codon:yes gene_type:complete
VKIRITENQYGQLVEQSLKDKLKLKLKKKALEKLGLSWDKVMKLLDRLQALQNPTPEDFDLLTNLSTTKLKAILKLIPSSKLNDQSIPSLYPIPIISTKLKKYINSCYGYRTATGTDRMHGGVDLYTQGISNNQPLMATCAGTVVSATETGDCGGFIKLECNNGDAVGYCHLRVINENLYGLKVPKGFPIGVSGGGSDPGTNKKEKGSGNSGGAHLHYITWQGGKKINPINMMSGGHTIPAGGRENRSGKFCDPSK